MHSAREEGYSRRLKHWFDSFGFSEDPFASYKAEGERAMLSSFFVDRPYLYDVLGHPAFPQAAFLMAGQGCGKTATRTMVDYECRHGKLRGRVLSVHYTNFDPLLKMVGGDLSKLTVEHHLATVLRFALKAMIDDVLPDSLDSLTDASRMDLMTFAQGFADPITRSDIALVAADEGHSWDWVNLSSREILQRFCRLVKAMGWEAAYVLVDRVDELPTTANNVENSVELLLPLVADQPLLAMPRIAFKFFLPSEVGAALQERVLIRRDRVYWHTINWTKENLTELIKLRLRCFSDHNVTRFEDLCTHDARYAVMDRLLEASALSPRNLLRLCRSVIQCHVESIPTTLLLSRSDVSDAVDRFSHQLEMEDEGVSPAFDGRKLAPIDTPPPKAGIHLDGRGHVWIDGEEMTPPPSRLEMRLLETLYYKAPEVVDNESLIDAVWSVEPKPWDVHDEPPQEEDETNLRKLVARLRRRLDDHRAGSSMRFIRNQRGRGYYLKRK